MVSGKFVKEMEMKQVVLDYETRKKALKLIPVVPGEPEMTESESAFLCGLLRQEKPKTILEVGVAAGATTAIMLQCLKDIGENFFMYSIDIAENYYRDESKKSGFLGSVANETLRCGGWRLLTGHVTPYYKEILRGGIDFVMLDSAHAMPGEVLDFLGIFPYLNDEAMVCLHDISLNLRSPMHCSNVASKLLFHAIVADKYLNFWDDESAETQYPNIAAFKINSETREFIEDVFGMLTMNWGYMPDSREMKYYEETIKDHYDENCRKIFQTAYLLNHTGKSSLELRLRKIIKILIKGRV